MSLAEFNEEQLAYLRDECGYEEYRLYPNGVDAAITRIGFNYAICADLDLSGYGRRWCYHYRAQALDALRAWNGEDEPTGWHRDPITGRRREGGDPEKEYVNP